MPPLLLAVGLILGLVMCRVSSHIRVRLDRDQVISYCREMDGRESWTIRELQRSPEFRDVVMSLDDYLAHPNILTDARSTALYCMVWKAAFVSGGKKQVAAAMGACMKDKDAGYYILYDLASHLPEGFLHGVVREATPESVQLFLFQMANRPMDSYGYTDYSGVVRSLMRGASEEDTRLYAAYCEAKWHPDTEWGREGRDMIAAGVKRKGWLATMLSDRLRPVPVASN